MWKGAWYVLPLHVQARLTHLNMWLSNGEMKHSLLVWMVVLCYLCKHGSWDDVGLCSSVNLEV